MKSKTGEKTDEKTDDETDDRKDDEHPVVISAYNNNKFKISASTWNDEFDLPNGSYSILDIQDYFEYIIKKHETIVDNPPVQIYVNKIKNRIIFKIKTGYKLQLLSLETMKLKMLITKGCWSR